MARGSSVTALCRARVKRQGVVLLLATVCWRMLGQALLLALGVQPTDGFQLPSSRGLQLLLRAELIAQETGAAKVCPPSTQRGILHYCALQFVCCSWVDGFVGQLLPSFPLQL